MTQITIALGTNLGDRADNLRTALQMLQPTVRLIAQSDVYETEPWGYADQENFYNMAILGETTLDPFDLLTFIKEIEMAMGRIKTVRNGPRIIDLDLIFYGDKTIATDNLTVPHPRYHERGFVLTPLGDLAKHADFAADPVTGAQFKEQLERCEAGEIRHLGALRDILSRTIAFGKKTQLMGIVNLTPDSFSQEGILRNATGDDAIIEAALAQSRAFLSAGATILDLGAESTRPGFTPVPANEEIRRLIPTVSALRSELPEAILSIDTTKARVAEVALEAGADWINDISGGDLDPDMLHVVADAGCPMVIMRYAPFTPGKPVAGEVISQLTALVSRAKNAGIADENIILDPGVGFGASAWENVAILRGMKALKNDERLGAYPVLLGPSRKSVLGHFLQKPVGERTAGTAALVMAGIEAGCEIIRLHDVAFMADVIAMGDLLKRDGLPFRLI